MAYESKGGKPEDSGLLGCYTVSIRKQLPAFRRNFRDLTKVNNNNNNNNSILD
jgi:hypothetical protein